MKITFEFDTLAETFDKQELESVQKSNDYYLALYAVWEYIRTQWKYHSEDPDNIEKIYDNILTIFDDFGVKVP